MTQMAQANYKYTLVGWRRIVWTQLLVSIIGCLPVVAAAKQPVTKVKLDATTATQGYTLQLNTMAVGIPPATLQSSARMWLRQKKKYPPLPDTLQAVSPVYVYTIRPRTPPVFGQPLWLSFSWPTDDALLYERRLYRYNDGAARWEPLASSQLDVFAGHVQAAWPLLYSTVVVADDTSDSLAPIRRSDSTSFGLIDAASAIAIDETTGAVVYDHHPNAVRPLASLTKMMTAYVLLEDGIDLAQEVTYHSSYDQIGARLYLNEGEIVTVEDLLYALLIGSANNAAYALVDAAGYSVSDFVAKMNETAANVQLTKTTLTDPSGLDPANTSTAYEYATFLRIALQNEQLASITATPFYAFTTKNTGVYHDFAHTNALMKTTDLNITSSKTGYLDEALYCLAMRVTDDDHSIISVVLGSATSSGRFTEAADLTRWVQQSYSW